MKRTTLLLDDSLYAELKRRAAAEQRTLTDVVERSLLAGLRAGRGRASRRAIPSYDLGPYLEDPARRGPDEAPRTGRVRAMIAVDTSVLAFAVNRHAREHARAAAALDALANGDHAWALPWPVVDAFVRFVTRPHVAPRPLAPSDALGFIDALLASPSVSAIGPTDRHAAVLAELLPNGARADAAPAGFEVAAVLREHGVRELLSVDAGMRRFAFLSVIDPVHGPPWTPEAAPSRRYRRLAPPGS